MAAENILAKEVVEILIRGAKKAEQDIDNLKKKLKQAEDQANKFQLKMTGVGEFARRAFTVATAATTGFVAAGLRGTVEGERLKTSFEGLSRQIASVFLPSINRGIDLVDRLTNKFKGLSGEQQTNIRKWAEVSAAGLSVGLTLGKINPLLGLVGGTMAAGVASSDKLQSALGRLGQRFAETFGPTLQSQLDAAGDRLNRLADILEGRLKQAVSGIDWGKALQHLSANLQGLLTGSPFAWANVMASSWTKAGAGGASSAGRSDVTPKPADMMKTPAWEKIGDAFKRMQASAFGQDLPRIQVDLLKAILEEMKKSRAIFFPRGAVP
jgi:hypothetical protein